MVWVKRIELILLTFINLWWMVRLLNSFLQFHQFALPNGQIDWELIEKREVGRPKRTVQQSKTNHLFLCCCSRGELWNSFQLPSFLLCGLWGGHRPMLRKKKKTRRAAEMEGLVGRESALLVWWVIGCRCSQANQAKREDEPRPSFVSLKKMKSTLPFSLPFLYLFCNWMEFNGRK